MGHRKAPWAGGPWYPKTTTLIVALGSLAHGRFSFRECEGAGVQRAAGPGRWHVAAHIVRQPHGRAIALDCGTISPVESKWQVILHRWIRNRWTIADQGGIILALAPGQDGSLPRDALRYLHGRALGGVAHTPPHSSSLLRPELRLQSPDTSTKTLASMDSHHPFVGGSFAAEEKQKPGHPLGSKNKPKVATAGTSSSGAAVTHHPRRPCHSSAWPRDGRGGITGGRARSGQGGAR
jgi:hypothetical protein